MTNGSSNDSPDGVTFLTSLLVRFPELGSACLTCRQRHLQLNFYLQQQLEEEHYQAFQEHLELSWDVFFDLQRLVPAQATIARSEARPEELRGQEDDAEVDSLQIERDIDTLTLEELSLVVTLVRDAFGPHLALNEEVPDEETGDQEELLHRSLERLRGHDVPDYSLTGFRDEMRVLIYSSEEK